MKDFSSMSDEELLSMKSVVQSKAAQYDAKQNALKIIL